MTKATNRFRTVIAEVLEGRCLLNAAPVGIADTYQVERDTALIADRPLGLDSFATDFSDGVLGPHLEGEGFVVRNGSVQRQGAANQSDRTYVRTVAANLLNVDFR